jgi:hypothetical protein
MDAAGVRRDGTFSLEAMPGVGPAPQIGFKLATLQAAAIRVRCELAMLDQHPAEWISDRENRKRPIAVL